MLLRVEFHRLILRLSPLPAGPWSFHILLAEGIPRRRVLQGHPVIGSKGLDGPCAAEASDPEFFSPPNGLLGRSLTG